MLNIVAHQGLNENLVSRIVYEVGEGNVGAFKDRLN